MAVPSSSLHSRSKDPQGTLTLILTLRAWLPKLGRSLGEILLPHESNTNAVPATYDDLDGLGEAEAAQGESGDGQLI